MSSNSTPYKTSQRPRRSPNRLPQRSLDIDNSHEDYVIISKNPHFDEPQSRPSYSSEMGDSHLSHEPLIRSIEPSSRHDKSTEAEPPLLTSNKLDPAQRAALVRQTRKIHKLLGETPQIAEAPQPLPSRPPGNRLQRRGTLAGSDIRLDRSAAAAALESPNLQSPAGSAWGIIASSLVATSPGLGTNVNAPLLKLNVVPSTGEAIPSLRQRRLSDSSIASSTISSLLSIQRGSNTTAMSPPPENTEHSDGNQAQRHAPNKSKSKSSGIYIPPSPTSPPPSTIAAIQRQQGRARMAKLQQIMGESVPSELVMSTRPNQRSRRLSMESRVGGDPPEQILKHKRSRSMWKKGAKEDVAFDSAPEISRSSKGHARSKSSMPPIEDLLLRQLQAPVSDRQRALNVKRALKMAAVFGVPPPRVLYQDRIGSQDSQSLDSVASRQSLASLAYMLDHDRDSLYDLLASADDSGSDSDQEPVEWPYEHKPRSDSLPDANAAKGSTKYTIAGQYPDMVPPTPPFGGLFEREVGTTDSFHPIRTTSRRPPPLTIVSTTTSASATNNGVMEIRKVPLTPGMKSSSDDAKFSARRRRAHKLSRFFGVGYNDLFNVMVYENAATDGQSSSLAPPVPLLPSSSSPSTPKNGPSSASRANLAVSSGGHHMQSGTVLVQTDAGKSTVLRTSSNVAADVDADDLTEVMVRLRALRG